MKYLLSLRQPGEVVQHPGRGLAAEIAKQDAYNKSTATGNCSAGTG
jgi:hypothetical protein